ncbi:MAG TPA: hypothetical protein VJJ82_04985 [Candidatus Nanoarchaeia archaeon]|nr:hypothetical protein [Candidatus Nanoarchaeia archaeon]
MEGRDIAAHAWISELSQGKIVHGTDGPSALVVNGKSFDRIRIYGIAVATDDLVVDDGTGSMLVRSFDDQWKVAIGDSVLVIGRPRVYEGAIYLLGEIVKKIDAKWIELRKKIASAPESQNQSSRVLEIVRKHDGGEGADYDAVVGELGSKGEELIVHLLATGELFETKPGKLKVLE